MNNTIPPTPRIKFTIIDRIVRFSTILGLHKIEPLKYAYASKANCLNQLHINADIVFLGDSLSHHGKFDSLLHEYKVCNLGVPDDTIQGLLNRLNEVYAVSPKKLFVMGGINTLSKYNYKKSLLIYETLLKDIKKYFPETDVYIQSVLPVSKSFEKFYLSNDLIREYNSKLIELSSKYQFTYIDLYSAYAKDGFLNSEYTADGLHLKTDSYIVWSNIIRKYL